MKFKLSFLFIFIFAASSVYAQNPSTSFIVKGTVMDSATNKPVDFVTIAFSTAAGQAVKTVLTKSDGTFSIPGVAAGKYKTSIITVGYAKKTIDVDLFADKDLGMIMIKPVSTNLKEVVVMADRPLIKQDIDKITYDLQADPESKVNSVLEMMRKVPLLSVDAEDNIQLKGSGNYKILINGRPSGMIERNAKDVLKSMPASSIQSIEVITNPPAKYDSEGMAGIINIVTNKKVDNGYNGSININQRFPVGGPGAGGSFTFKQGKFGISGYGSLNSSSSPETNSYTNRISTGTNPASLTQRGTRISDNKFGYMGSELSFEIDSLNLISGQFGFNNSVFNSTIQSKSSLQSSAGIKGYDLNNEGKGTGDGIDAALNYQLGFKSNKNRMLTFSYRYYVFGNNNRNNLLASNKVEYMDIPDDYQQENNSGSSEQTIQLDYVHPVKKLNIEGGIKDIIRSNDSDFEYRLLNASTGNYEADPKRTNKFDNKQNIFGIYNSYQYNLKEWGFKAGLRLEQTNINADFISSASKVDQSYFNLIPSVSVNRKFKNRASLSFGYTQRIQRPSIWNLNPFIDSSNPNFESTGNPDLKAVLANNFQLNYSKFKKGSVNLGLNYSFSNNTIQRISVFNPSTNITKSSFENIGKDKSLGSNFNVNYPITKKWNFNISGTLSYVWIEGMVNGALAKNDGIRGFMYGSTGYRFDKGWRIGTSFNYHSPNITLQGKSSSFLHSSFNVNKDIIKDKLSFSASISNPFAKYRNNNNETTGTNFIQTSFSQSYYRSFTSSLNYRFGKLKEAIKKNKRGINNDDVSGGGSAGPQ